VTCTITKGWNFGNFSASPPSAEPPIPERFAYPRGAMDEERIIGQAWGPTALARIERALGDSPRDEGVYFDFDNTLIRGDIGDLVMLELLSSEPLARPSTPETWGPLSAAAHDALEHAFGAQTRIALDDPRRREVARTLVSVVWHEELAPGTPAFHPPRTRAYRGGYWAMAAMLDALDRDARVALAERAWERALERPVGDAVTHEGYVVERFARPRAAMLALLSLAERAGLRAFVVSASHEDVVRTVAARLGIDPTRVIGARPARSRELFPPLEGAPVMTYDAGKRASIVHHVEGGPAHGAHERRARVAIAAGDSDTDHAMLEDASSLIVLVDRGQPRVTELARRREAEGRVAVLRVPFEP